MFVGRTEQIVRGGVDVDPRVAGLSIGRALRVRGDHRRQGQARNGLDERRVERRPGEAVSDQPDAEWLERSRR